MAKKTIPKRFNLVDSIMAYEGGNMTIREFLELFGYLIKTGQAWRLQGMYGRQAHRLIQIGDISKTGEVQWSKVKKKGINLDAMLYNE